jgi:hypothetical protein
MGKVGGSSNGSKCKKKSFWVSCDGRNAIRLTSNDQLTSKSHTSLAVVVETGMGRLFGVEGMEKEEVEASSGGRGEKLLLIIPQI